MSIEQRDVREHLARVLDEERRLLGEFEGVLNQETEILRGEDADAIARIGDNRQRYVDALSRLDGERTSACRMLSFGNGPDALARLLDWADPGGQLKAQWSGNLDVARRCKSINDRNGAIVSAKLQRVSQLLGQLRGSSAPPVYSARGGRPGGLGARSLGCA